MKIDYIIDEAQVYLYRIYYTYHASLSGYAYRVEFDLQDRNDDPLEWYDRYRFIQNEIPCQKRPNGLNQ